jgi:hypothetical protein
MASQGEVLRAAALTQPHFSVSTIAELWGYSEDTVTRLFKERKGVMKIGTPAGRGRRPRLTLRIPYAVMLDVYSELTR